MAPTMNITVTVNDGKYTDSAIVQITGKYMLLSNVFTVCNLLFTNIIISEEIFFKICSLWRRFLTDVKLTYIQVNCLIK